MAMPVRDRKLYKAEILQANKILSEAERKKIIHDYKPIDQEDDEDDEWAEHNVPSHPRFGLRRALRNKLHLALFTIMHSIFSLYIRIRQAWHIVAYRISSILFYHHRTPAFIERDVDGLKKKPQHLSVVLKVGQGGRHSAELERLVNEAAEIAVWCTCAKIPTLTVYERTGSFKKYLPHVQQSINQKFRSYFGRHQPSLTVSMPHADEVLESPALGDFARADPRHLNISFISADDGRESMVDLTRTLAEMSQKNKLSPKDIGMDLIGAELSEGIMPEPDLLILFGPHVELDGYPPWPIRLTEIFCLPDNQEVGYQVFLRALRNFANAQFRKGK
ncbi:hypothetical protein BN1708_012592 [Verticillium longisporum]|uniref:ditrans,polycis-polyprenyl diphosphate synthase [(2E,6E)-farnesyldiphosphate specific] n=1 Tax=Verticillium longisporum TaxID=100787 RepID=A0A0G4LB73_VERLO|nr:hypothetical protein BN1708_012592 [Verticillium longisporum]